MVLRPHRYSVDCSEFAWLSPIFLLTFASFWFLNQRRGFSFLQPAVDSYQPKAPFCKCAVLSPLLLACMGMTSQVPLIPPSGHARDILAAWDAETNG